MEDASKQGLKTSPKERIRVLFLITKGTSGGAQRYVHDLATHIPREAFEPHVAYGLHGRLVDDLEREGISTHHIPSLSRDTALVADAKSFFEILKCIKKTRPDVVHLNSSKAAALGALAARIARVPRIVFTVHGWPFGEKRNFISRVIIWKISWLTGLLSHAVVCVSEHDLAQTRYMPFLRRKSVRIYNGIAPMEFGTGERVRSSFPPGTHITGTIGELTHNKNQIALIEQARKDPRMYAAIVGEGELRKMLERKVAEYKLNERVRFFGYIPAADALKGFDTFALPSLKEGLPYVLLEARLAGLPIVANRVGGVGEILDAQDMSVFSLETMARSTAELYRQSR